MEQPVSETLVERMMRTYGMDRTGALKLLAPVRRAQPIAQHPNTIYRSHTERLDNEYRRFGE